MTDLSEFDRRGRSKQSHPKGWEAGVTYNPEKGGVINSGPLTDEPNEALWSELIADFGLDPATTEVVAGSIQVRAWDANIGGGETQRLRYYRATLKPRENNVVERDDLDATIAEIKKHKPVKTVKNEGKVAFVVIGSDWQAGKAEGGGSKAIAERVLAGIDNTVLRIKELQKAGRPISSIYLVGLGDLVEQCDGYYPMQTFGTDLDRRQQMKLVRQLLVYAVQELSKFGLPVILGAVPGNHGENRSNGKAFTTWTDNDDLAVFEQVAEIFSHNEERYGNVSVPSGAIAEDLTMTLDIEGVIVGFAHGHQFRSGANSQAKMETWWRGQVMGRQPIADAEILFAGHLHHFVISENTGRTVIQVPAMDGGSAWYTATSGSSSPAGMLTLTIGDGVGTRGWSDLLII